MGTELWDGVLPSCEAWTRISRARWVGVCLEHRGRRQRSKAWGDLRGPCAQPPASWAWHCPLLLVA